MYSRHASCNPTHPKSQVYVSTFNLTLE